MILEIILHFFTLTFWYVPIITAFLINKHIVIEIVRTIFILSAVSGISISVTILLVYYYDFINVSILNFCVGVYFLSNSLILLLRTTDNKHLVKMSFVFFLSTTCAYLIVMSYLILVESNLDSKEVLGGIVLGIILSTAISTIITYIIYLHDFERTIHYLVLFISIFYFCNSLQLLYIDQLLQLTFYNIEPYSVFHLSYYQPLSIIGIPFSVTVGDFFLVLFFLQNFIRVFIFKEI